MVNTFFMKRIVFRLCKKYKFRCWSIIVQAKFLQVIPREISAREYLSLMVTMPSLCLVSYCLIIILYLAKVFATVLPNAFFTNHF